MPQTIRNACLIFLLTSTSAWANSFYLGAGIGPETADFKKASTVLILPPGARTLDSNVKDTTHLSGTGVFGTIFGGYHWSRDRCYLAGEINVNFSNDDFDSENLEFVHSSFSHTAFKLRNSFGLSLLPGYLYSPTTVFYLRAGYSNANFKIATSDTSLANVNKNLSGFRFGAGVNHAFSEHLGGRMEYSQTAYQGTQFTVIDGAATKTTRITPTTSQVEFSLYYDFA